MNRQSMFLMILAGIFAGVIQNVSGQVITIPVETSSNALVLQVSPKGELGTIYLGKKLKNSKEYANIPGKFRQGTDYTVGAVNAAYSTAGSRNLFEPAVTVTHADGNNSLDLKYVSHVVTKPEADVSLLSILLRDPVYNFEVTLYYKSYYKEDVVEQWSAITHREKGPVTLHKFASANLYLRAPQYWLTQYHGDWAKEMQPEEVRLTHGIKTLDSKLGTRANLFQPSVFMISLDKPATEDEGTMEQ
jgi:alpha-galactosidase